MTGMDWHRLATAIINRRTELGYRTREALLDHIKETPYRLSRRVLADLETGRRENYDRATVTVVEKVLEWPAGMAARILRGRPEDEKEGPIKPAIVEAEIATLAGLHAWLHRMEPAVLGALLHRSGLDFEAKWDLVNREREQAIEQLRANWVRMAERVLAAGGTVDPDTWPSWLEAPALVDEIRKKQGDG